MREEVRQDLVLAVKQACAAAEAGDSAKLSEISNHTIHNASIYQDPGSLTIAVVMYALSKILDRSQDRADHIVDVLSDAGECLAQNNVPCYNEKLKKVLELIGESDKKLNLYVQKVINEAEVKKGSRLYEHGISLGQTAGLLGISQWELMNYVGKTRISDSFDEPVGVMERIGHARRVFGLR